jgi:chemotaxis protein methyltransferase CheR
MNAPFLSSEQFSPETRSLDDIVAAPLSEAEFEKIRRLVYERFGIHLTPEKRSMVMVRLQKVLRRLGLRSFNEYYDYIAHGRDAEALIEFANHITTNHTFFFREKEHFDFFSARLLPEMTTEIQRSGELDFRLWCAGCSSGEEAYTLAMLMLEFFGPRYREWTAGVLATDISEKALIAAEQGVYSDERLQLVPPDLKQKYFQRLPNKEWKVKPALRKELTFRKFNLMNSVFPFKKPFHVIFCRNVMIYFDKTTRDALIQRFYDALVSGGYLFVGHSETIDRTLSSFQYIQPALYQKPRR